MNLFRRKNHPPVQNFPVLRTERLVLRTFDPNDAVDVYAYAQSEKVGPMAGWAPHKCLDDSRRVIKKLGFTCEGTLRRTTILYDGTYADSIVYSLFKEEYEAQMAASR